LKTIDATVDFKFQLRSVNQWAMEAEDALLLTIVTRKRLAVVKRSYHVWTCEIRLRKLSVERFVVCKSTIIL
jgi:hypothetical protein